MSAKIFLKNWVPPLVWVLVIFAASTDLMSAEHTSRFIGPFLRWISPDVTPGTITSVQLAVRKAAHVAEYAVLAILLARALAVGAVARLVSGRALLTTLSATSCAAFDEFHQSFVTSRTASAVDVLIDMSGAVVGLLFYWWGSRWNVRRAAARNAKATREFAGTTPTP